MLAKTEKPNFVLDGVRLARLNEVAPNKYAAHVKFESHEVAFKREAENVVSSYLNKRDVPHRIETESTKFSFTACICVIFHI